MNYVLISVFGGYHVTDARSQRDKPQATAHGIGPKAHMDDLCAAIDPQHPNVVYEVLPLSTAKARYTVTA